MPVKSMAHIQIEQPVFYLMDLNGGLPSKENDLSQGNHIRCRQPMTTISICHVVSWSLLATSYFMVAGEVFNWCEGWMWCNLSWVWLCGYWIDSHAYRHARMTSHDIYSPFITALLSNTQPCSKGCRWWSHQPETNTNISHGQATWVTNRMYCFCTTSFNIICFAWQTLVRTFHF